MKPEPVIVLCMKWGRRYEARYVNVLARAAADHLSRPHRFVCLTDNPAGLDAGAVEALPIPDMNLPSDKIAEGGWPKLAVFKPQLHDLAGLCLFLDLDVVIRGELDPFFEAGSPGELRIIREWPRALFRRAERVNSSVFRFRLGGQGRIYQAFRAAPQAAFARFRIEQYFLAAHAGGLAHWPAAWCQSFKSACLRPIPLNFVLPPKPPPPEARIMVFHGRPNPLDLARGGLWGRRLRRGFGPVGWVRDYWARYGAPPSSQGVQPPAPSVL